MSLSAAQNKTNTTGHGVTLGWGTNKNGVCSTRELRKEALPCHTGADPVMMSHTRVLWTLGECCRSGFTSPVLGAPPWRFLGTQVV